MGRLLSLVHSGGAGVLISQSYIYDPYGNRSSTKTSTEQSFVAQAVSNQYDIPNRLLQNGASNLSYDDDGNLISAVDSSGTTAYTWDSRNRLQSISAPNGQKA